MMGNRLLRTQQNASSRAWEQVDRHRLKPYFGWQQWNLPNNISLVKGSLRSLILAKRTALEMSSLSYSTGSSQTQ